MNVLFLSDVPIQNPTSGSEQVLNQQSIGLVKLGLNVCTITRINNCRNTAQFSMINGVNDACYSVNPQKTIRSLSTVLKSPPYLFDKFTKQFDISHVIAHQPFTCFSLLLSGKLKNIPLLYVYHSPSHQEYELSNENRKFLRNLPHIVVRRLVEGICLKKSSKIMVLSEYMKDKIQCIHKISANRITVNTGGVDINRFKPINDRRRLKKNLGLTEHKIHLITVRNLEPRMGIDNLIKAMNILKRHGNIVHLTIGGVGPEKKNLQKLTGKLNLKKEVSFSGFILSELLPKFYNAADFFILPTRRLEGFGLVTLESMACGTPVLGTNIGGTKEILLPFHSQFLFKNSSPESIADGIEAVINRYSIDQNGYKNLRSGCRQYVEKTYSWKRHIDQLISIISEIS